MKKTMTSIAAVTVLTLGVGSAFAGDNNLASGKTINPLINSIHFTINNETGSPIKSLSVFPGITNLTPTRLTMQSLPVGITHLTFEVLNIGKSAGVALSAENGQSGMVEFSAGDTPKYAPYLDHSCKGSGTFAATCNAHVLGDGAYDVSVNIFTN